MHDIQCIHRFCSFDLGSALKTVSYTPDFPRNGQFWHLFLFIFLMGVVTGIWMDTLFSPEKIIYEADELMTWHDDILQMSEGILFPLKTVIYG